MGRWSLSSPDDDIIQDELCEYPLIAINKSFVMEYKQDEHYHGEFDHIIASYDDPDQMEDIYYDILDAVDEHIEHSDNTMIISCILHLAEFKPDILTEEHLRIALHCINLEKESAHTWENVWNRDSRTRMECLIEEFDIVNNLYIKLRAKKAWESIRAHVEEIKLKQIVSYWNELIHTPTPHNLKRMYAEMNVDLCVT